MLSSMIFYYQAIAFKSKVNYIYFMDAIHCIKTRRSVRNFKPDKIPDDILGKILEAATWAPSSGNLQNWEFVVARSPEIKESIARNCHQDFMARAPVIVVVCSNKKKVSNYGKRGEEFFGVQNTAAAAQNILLASHSLGIGTCWIGAFDEQKLSGMLELPEHVQPVAVIPMGYPEGKPRQTERIPVEEIAFIDKYRK